MRKKSFLSSTRLKELQNKKKRKSLNNLVLISGILFITVFFGLGFASQWERINIKSIKISGSQAFDENVLRKFIEEQISGNYLLIFPKSNVFFYRKDEIKNKLLEKYKILKDVTLKLNRNTLIVSIIERKGEHLWCGKTYDPNNKSAATSKSERTDECYFVDENGYVFSRAPYFSGNIYFKFYGNLVGSRKNNSVLKADVAKPTEEQKHSYPDSYSDSGRLDPTGFYIPEFFDNFNFLQSSLKELGIEPVSLFLKDDNDIELYLKSFSQNTPKIIFKRDADFNKIIENLRSLLADESFKSNFKKKYDSLLYIDLRFGNRVYQKFK